MNLQKIWDDMLEPGEQILTFSGAGLVRPLWQNMLTDGMPLLRFVWPKVFFYLAITNHDRVLIAETSGTIAAIASIYKNKRSYPKSAVKMENVVDEKVNALAKALNPALKDYKTQSGTLVLNGISVKICAVNSQFVEILHK
jgi:hypothetical protein